jgi:hypothetical protein
MAKKKSKLAPCPKGMARSKKTNRCKKVSKK